VHPVENLVWSKYVQTDLIHGAPLGLTVNDTEGGMWIWDSKAGWLAYI